MQTSRKAASGSHSAWFATRSLPTSQLLYLESKNGSLTQGNIEFILDLLGQLVCGRSILYNISIPCDAASHFFQNTFLSNFKQLFTMRIIDSSFRKWTKVQFELSGENKD